MSLLPEPECPRRIFYVEDGQGGGSVATEIFGAFDTVVDIKTGTIAEAQAAIDAEQAPHLILLDLGAENDVAFIRTIRRHPRAGMVPVIVLTRFSGPEHVLACYQAGANALIEKDGDQEFTERMQALAVFWCRIATLPFQAEPFARLRNEPA